MFKVNDRVENIATGRKGVVHAPALVTKPNVVLVRWGKETRPTVVSVEFIRKIPPTR